MEYLVSKIDAAVHQLDWAIKLFLDNEAYIPAITLSGAAEEILGQTLQDRAVFAQLKAKFAADTGLAESVISQTYLNKTKTGSNIGKSFATKRQSLLTLRLKLCNTCFVQ